MLEMREYKPGDEDVIRDLFATSFRRPAYPMAYWRWRFLDNPERHMMIQLMWDDDRLVGHYAVSPIRMMISGESVPAALSMVTMTHPDYAGRGILTKLADRVYETGRDRGKAFVVLGFPNDNSHYALIKNLRWVNREQIPTFFIDPTRVADTASARSDITIVENFGDAHLAAQARTQVGFDFWVAKVPATLTWRYLQHPTHAYTVFEHRDGDAAYYAVTKLAYLYDTEDIADIDIVELVFPPDGALLTSLLCRVKAHYRAGNRPTIQRINLWLPVDDEKHLPLERVGFANGLRVTYACLRILDERYAGLQRQLRWSYSMGDSDLY
jgi:GNAT superfamily N-acetyltransferase